MVIVRFAFSRRPSLLGTSAVNYFSFMNRYDYFRDYYIDTEYRFGTIVHSK